MRCYIFILGCIFGCGQKKDTTEDTQGFVEEPIEEPIEDEPDPVEDTATEEIEETEPGWDACIARQEDTTVYSLPTTQAEAAQLTIVPADGESYLLTRQDLSEGWFVLEVSSWMCDVELYTEEGVTLILEESPDVEISDVGAAIGECSEEGLYRYSWTFHAWGSYLVQVQAVDQQEIWLGSLLVLEQ